MNNNKKATNKLQIVEGQFLSDSILGVYYYFNVSE